MKKLAIMAAAVAATFVIPAASAAPVSAPSAPMAISVPTAASVTVEQDRRGYRDNRRGYRDHRRGRRAYNRRVCNNRWRNGHRVRVCRTVRAWR